MSRRRVSVKELDPVDHQGWLFRKKDGKAFLGIKWKKYWFVLKKTSLYWYTSQMAEKADGYINLTDFLVDRAIECKKKHAFKACHPNHMIFYFAAENSEEMNIWLNKLGLAAIQYEPARSHQAECYSEASDGEEAESTDAPPPPYSEQLTKDPVSADSPRGNGRPGSLPPPYSSPVPSEATPASTVTSHGSASSLAKRRLSWMDLVSQAGPVSAAEALTCSAQVHTQGEELGEPPRSQGPQAMEQPPHQSAIIRPTHLSYGEESAADEMEKLYRDLKRASLSPTGERRPSSRREFRASFIKRCKNTTVNDKLHLIRTLNSTLKAKEADVLTLDQVLTDASLTASKYRQWKESNMVLLQEICLHHPPQSRPPEAPVQSAAAPPVTETSV
ncbi:interactor protein for cytohesin exchange factors 1-like [Brachyhypopomus gauderio]|uniref:interactor protein for cytohesin exchange factors 1-like n=1 Tax=Brachyhypopomus gauderio TaxID=698409 RepID=UPI00404150D9